MKVNEIIDERLKDFQQAQKSAFKELEAALDLLGKHQNLTLSSIKNKNKKTYENTNNFSNNKTVADYSISKLTRNAKLDKEESFNDLNYEKDLDYDNSNLNKKTKNSFLKKNFLLLSMLFVILVMLAFIFQNDQLINLL